MRTQKQDETVEAFKTWYMWHNPRTQFAPNGYLCLSLGAEKKLRVDKAPRASISNVIWILSSDMYYLSAQLDQAHLACRTQFGDL